MNENPTGTIFDPLPVVCGCCLRDGRFLVHQRPADAKENPGLWEMPGGKMEDNDRIEFWGANVWRWELEREWHEELGIRVTAGPRVSVVYGVPSATPGRYYDIHLLWVRIPDDQMEKIQPLASQEVRWVTVEEARELPGVPTFRTFVEAVASWAVGEPIGVWVLPVDPITNQSGAIWERGREFWPEDPGNPVEPLGRVGP